MEKNIINNLHLFFDNIILLKNNYEKKIFYLFFVKKLKNIYNKIIKKKSLCKKSDIKIDNNFFILFNNYITNYGIIYDKQIGGLNLMISDKILENYIIKNNNNHTIIDLLLEKINYLKKRKLNKYVLLKKSKFIDNDLINYINTLLELDKLDKLDKLDIINNKNNKNIFFDNFESKYLDNLIVNYLKNYKKGRNIDILRLINDINNIIHNTKYNIYIYVKFLYGLFSINNIKNNKFLKKILFLIIIIYGLNLLEYYFDKINKNNCNFLYYYLILIMIICKKI